MKTALIWVFVALLFGFALFGFFKSLELATRNAILNNSIAMVKDRLDTTDVALKASRQALSDSYLKNAELEGTLAGVELKLTRQSKEIESYVGKISLLSEKLQDTARDNAYLSRRNEEMTNQLMREKLEADEMRSKLSSVVELKKAIRELKIKMRQSKKSAPRVSPASASELPERKEITKELIEGNRGYFIKDGQSVFEEIVDIRVVPAESK